MPRNQQDPLANLSAHIREARDLDVLDAREHIREKREREANERLHNTDSMQDIPHQDSASPANKRLNFADTPSPPVTTRSPPGYKFTEPRLARYTEIT